MSTQDDSKPFRLMDLPTELRLMIYRRLPRQIKHTEARYVGGLYLHSNKTIDSTVILITRHLPLAILRTSRQIHDEAYDIVAHLIQTFVTDSQPRVIGHEMHLHALYLLKRCITIERIAYLNGQPFNMNAVIQRLHVTMNSWHFERSRDIAIFLGQTTLAQTAGSTDWSHTIATVRFADMNDPAIGSILFPSMGFHQGMPMLTSSQAAMRSNALLRNPHQFNGNTTPQIDNDYMFVHAPDGKFEFTPERVPRKPDLDKFFRTGSWELETCMSQDAWIGEWLPSS